MKILVSNDDGFDVEGIVSLANELAEDNEVIIFAPDTDKSASSSSLTVRNKLQPIEVSDNVYKVNGTPSDCVHLATCGFFDFEFDLVVAGINLGANMGDDVIYSGTVACAIEARFLELPSIAFSLALNRMFKPQNDFKAAAKIAKSIVNNINNINMTKGTVLNVNIPNTPVIKGFQATRLGKRHQSGKIKFCETNNNNYYYLGANGQEDDNSFGTDFYAVNNDCVSITPLHIDLTKCSEINNVTRWVENLSCQIKL